MEEEPNDSQLEKLRQGVKIATGPTQPAKVKLKNGKIYLTIHEGKKHQVKRMFDAVGLSVRNLKRVRLGSLHLPADLPAGQYRVFRKEDILNIQHGE